MTDAARPSLFPGAVRRHSRRKKGPWLPLPTINASPCPPSVPGTCGRWVRVRFLSHEILARHPDSRTSFPICRQARFRIRAAGRAARLVFRWPAPTKAGRGPLAGPVVAAAVILDEHDIPEGLDDSKKLTAAHRERLFDAIIARATVSIASSSPRHIDARDIRKASLDAMRRAWPGRRCRSCAGRRAGCQLNRICPGRAEEVLN